MIAKKISLGLLVGFLVIFSTAAAQAASVQTKASIHFNSSYEPPNPDPLIPGSDEKPFVTKPDVGSNLTNVDNPKQSIEKGNLPITGDNLDYWVIILGLIFLLLSIVHLRKKRSVDS